MFLTRAKEKERFYFDLFGAIFCVPLRLMFASRLLLVELSGALEWKQEHKMKTYSIK